MYDDPGLALDGDSLGSHTAVSMTHPDVFRLSDRMHLVPVVNSAGSYARALERWLGERGCDALLVPLPEAFAAPVLEAAAELPRVAAVIQPPGRWWTPEDDLDDEESPVRETHYVPVDPCQAVIAAIRYALGEHVPVHFIDAPAEQFVPLLSATADDYAVRHCTLESFATAMLPAVGPLGDPQRQRVAAMAANMRRLHSRYRRSVTLCPMAAWPWLREQFLRPSDGTDDIAIGPPDDFEIADRPEPQLHQVDERTLMFFLGELPFATGLYEQLRGAGNVDAASAAIDYVKHLLVTARKTYQADLRDRARKIPPLLLNQCMQYIRNLTLLDGRLSPDLYTIIVACKQVVGDQFAVHAVEAAKEYAFAEHLELPTTRFGVDRVELPGGDVCRGINLLDSPPVTWRSIELRPRPTEFDKKKWAMRWNPFGECSWPPEDEAIESFRSHAVDRAAAMVAADLARSEKFSTSILDGIDIRETLRHWYDGEIYVRRTPPAVTKMDACVMLFDVPADPRRYPSRATWSAEHAGESTLAFFATDYRSELVGPGVAMAVYGGAMFLYPPRSILEVWTDPRLDDCDTLEERLIAAACVNSQARHVALISPTAPTASWRRIASRHRKRLVHLPLSKFSDATIQQLRMFHVLNGKHVRSYASQFIRRV